MPPALDEDIIWVVESVVVEVVDVEVLFDSEPGLC
jgi:hypothetical protein